MPADCELKKLRQVQFALEKTDTWVKVLQAAGMMAFVTAVDSERQKEEASIHLHVAKIVKPLNEIKMKLTDWSNVDLDALKRDMIIIRDDIFNSIHLTKSKLKELHEKELQLCDELKYYQDLVPVWQEAKKVDLHVVNNFKERKTATKLEQDNLEVHEFSKFVHKSKGIQEGWDAKYHCIYLKMRTKYRDVNELALEFHNQFPDKSEEDVVTYDTWYRDYLQLKEKKKQAILNWRSSKKFDVKEGSADNIEKECVVERKQSVTENREEIKEKLAIWKQKQAQKQRSEEETMMALKGKWRQLKEYERLKNDAIKQHVDHWKSTKLAQEEAVKIEQLRIEEVVRKQKIIDANRLIKEYRAQDMPYIERLRKMHTLRDTLNERPVTKNSVIVARDPERLLRPTKQWQARTKKDDEENIVHDVYDVRTIKKLGIPMWRKHMQ